MLCPGSFSTDLAAKGLGEAAKEEESLQRAIEKARSQIAKANDQHSKAY